MNAYCETMKKLHNKKLPLDHSFPHISDWLIAIDSVSKDKLPKLLLDKAIHLKNKLLSTMSDETFLHGDLHHDNILQHGNEWIIIDPKGVVGEIEFEAAAFDFMNISELANNNDAKKIMTLRIEYLSKKANLNQSRLFDWIYVRLILMASWAIEDNCDPTWAINLANILSKD